MSFVEALREARIGRTTVLHEFYTNYNPNESRAHAFFEGHPDKAFYRPFIENHTRGRYRLYTYRCEGKSRVYDTFREISARHPECRGVLFFVDKDVDDILGVPWPTDPRIFVTDVYSIENYLADRSVLARLINDLLRFKNVSYPTDPLLEHFDRQLQRFYRRITPVMAWVVYSRRMAKRPNLGNVQMGHLLSFSSDCTVRFGPRGRLGYLDASAGISTPTGAGIHMRRVAKELSRIPPKRIVRGKFEIWFFVEFFKQLVAHLQSNAAEIGGTVRLQTPLEHSNAIEILTTRLQVPHSLDLFLRLHFPQTRIEPVEGPRETGIGVVSKAWRSFLQLIRG